MRPPPSPAAPKNQSLHNPTLPSTATSTCSPQTCRWRPYSSSNDFEANTVMVLIILSCALTCALALNAAIRCFLRGSSQQRSSTDPLPDQQRKPSLEVAEASPVASPTLVYSSGMKLAGAEAECVICLSEFVEGDVIQVMGRCKHGFHVQCIQRWLSSHHSCPTCRCICLPSSPSLQDHHSQLAVPSSTV